MSIGEQAGPRSLRRLLDAVLTVGSDLELGAVLQRIVEAAVELVDARYGALGVLDEEGGALAQFITVGIDGDARRAIGDPPKGHGILGLLILEPRPLRLPDIREHPDSFGFPPNHPPMRSFLGVPVRVRDAVFGNLYLTDKTTAEVFTDVDEELCVALAGAAGIAIENARLHERVRDVALLEDRERIARDLHDTVIQRLFASGLSLEGTARLIRARDTEVAARIEAVVEDLDVTVKQIRSAIFGLQSSRLASGGVRGRALALAREAAGSLGFDPRVIFSGPLDAKLSDAVADDLLATLREALSNVVRHAQATHVSIEISADDDALLVVVDDGVGIPATPSAGNGLPNMAARAERHGGSFAIGPAEPSGTRLEWRWPHDLRP